MSIPARTLLTLAIGLVAAPLSHAQIVYVDANANAEPHDGSSWCNGYLSLGQALGEALGNTTIRVAEGTYAPSSSGNRSSSFFLPDLVTVEGGYAGCGAPDPDERNITAYETILSGDLAGDDGPGFANRSDNSEHVVRVQPTTVMPVLDGLTISGGYTGSGTGAGILIEGSSPNITRCTIRDNFAGYAGGGVSASLAIGHAAAPTIEDCAFLDNRTDGYGGGGALKGHFGWPTIRNCVFARNTAPNGPGGAVNLYDNSQGRIEGCTFADNAAAYGGALYASFSDATIVSSRFLRNSGPAGGGAVYAYTAKFAFVNCEFVGNVASSVGGAVDIWAQKPAFTNCTFVANESLFTEAGGAAFTNSDAVLTNCVFRNNRGTYGASANAQIFVYKYSAISPRPTVNYSNIQGGWSGLGGIGNIDLPPRFVREPYDGGDGWGVGNNDDLGDLRLTAGSPCIDSGDKSVDTDLNTAGIQLLPSTDARALPRLVDDPVAPDVGLPPAVDMGAHEYQADCNTNAIIDSVDLDGEASFDCNDNGIPDECEPQDDCNTNATQDVCDLANGNAADCNRNDVLDVCDIAAGTSADSPGNGVPDECERSLGGYWRFDLQLETGCLVIDRYAIERRYLRFDEGGALIETWIERNGQYLKLNYPSTDGPSYNRFALDSLHTANVDRELGVVLFAPHAGTFRLTEFIAFTNEDYMGWEEPYAGSESGLTRIEGVMNAAGDAVTGTWLFQEQYDSLCGTLAGVKLPGAPPDLPSVIDLEAAAVAVKDAQIDLPGVVEVTSRDYRVKSSFLSGPVELRYLLSSDATPDEDDPVVGSELIQPGPDGTLGLHSAGGPTLTVPECIPPGDQYFVLMVVDVPGTISEYDEANNVASIEVTPLPLPEPTDLSGNCATDLADWVLFLECMSGPDSPMPAGCQPQRFARADLDNDGDADLADLVILLNGFDLP